ncbi:MAG: class I SAM-dependent methyltransferase [Lachnospiraceae bacterium]|nr:class I SAM-dependent methyltransferase [Lachnospiraceae bacterium]
MNNMQFLRRIGSVDKPEMSEWQMQYLCELIRKKRPKKMLEVGVAAGGTTAIILNCLANESIDCEFISTDISENYYRDYNLKTGYVAEKAKKIIEKPINHRLCIGILANLIEEIGDTIDFLILDTVHMLPGEILDFLVALPYLNEGAIVVLHDVVLHQFDKKNRYGCATQILLDSVVADKKHIFNVDNKYGYPNIAAFEIKADTYKYIYDVFSALTLPWQYLPNVDDLNTYRKKYIKLHYDEDCLKVYDCACKMNLETVSYHLGKKIDEFKIVSDFVANYRNKKMYIYGAGIIGQRVYRLLEDTIDFQGFVISDDENIVTKKTFHLRDVKENMKNTLVLIAVNVDIQNILVEMLKCNEIENYCLVSQDICDCVLNI